MTDDEIKTALEFIKTGTCLYNNTIECGKCILRESQCGFKTSDENVMLVKEALAKVPYEKILEHAL